MKNSIWNDRFWCDRMWIEDDKGWFTLASRNALFDMDLETNVCKLLTLLPDYSVKNWRRNPGCIKYENHIYCMPGYGNCIWNYNMDTEEVTSIVVAEEQEKSVGMYYYWVIGDVLYAVSNFLQKIFKINLRNGSIEDSVSISNKETVLGQSILVEDSIYTVSQSESIIYEYHIKENKMEIHHLESVNSKLFTIEYDGEKFWLTGYKKEIYVWGKKDNTLEIICDFPKEFGKYIFDEHIEESVDYAVTDFEEPLFSSSVNSDKYIWFIPYRTNMILYVNKINHHINSLNIEEEIETKDTLLNKKIQDKFFLQYVNKMGKICLFSTKKKLLLEIDMNNLTWKYEQIDLDIDNGKCRGKQNTDIIKDTIFTESESIFFWSLVCRGN